MDRAMERRGSTCLPRQISEESKARDRTPTMNDDMTIYRREIARI